MSNRSRLLTLLSLAALTSVARASGYSYTTIDAAGADGTVVTGINNSGHVAGYWVNQTPFGLLYSAFTANGDGTGFTQLTRPGSLALGASGIDSAGNVVGVSVDFSATAKGFYRSAAGTYSDVDPNLGGIASGYSEAVGINDSGTIVGYYTSTTPASQADVSQDSIGFILHGGTYSSFDAATYVSGAHGTQIFSVNNAGIVSGRYVDGTFGAPRGFVYDPNSNTFFSGGLGSEFGMINNFGQFTGLQYTGVDPSSPLGYDALGFVVSGGTPSAFAFPGAATTQPLGINDLGQVTGLYVGADNVIHGFVATPVPEPASFAALGVGVVALLRRRRQA